MKRLSARWAGVIRWRRTRHLRWWDISNAHVVLYGAAGLCGCVGFAFVWGCHVTSVAAWRSAWRTNRALKVHLFWVRLILVGQLPWRPLSCVARLWQLLCVQLCRWFFSPPPTPHHNSLSLLDWWAALDGTVRQINVLTHNRLLECQRLQRDT